MNWPHTVHWSMLKTFQKEFDISEIRPTTNSKGDTGMLKWVRAPVLPLLSGTRVIIWLFLQSLELPVLSFLNRYGHKSPDRFIGFPGGTVKNPPANAGDARDVGSTSASGRSPGGGNGKPLQYSCLENPMVRGAWWATVHGVAKSWTQLKRLCCYRLVGVERNLLVVHRICFKEHARASMLGNFSWCLIQNLEF